MSSTSGYILKNETPLVETVTGYPIVNGTTEYYPTYPTVTGMKTTPFVGCGVGCTGVESTVPFTTYKYVVDVLNVAEDSYLTGHQVDGRVLYPTTGYLYLVWKSLAKLNGFTTVEQMPITFENVEIHRATILAIKQQIPTKQIEFCVRIVPKTGVFELFEGENVIVTGRVAIHESIAKLEQLKMLVHQHLTQLSERKRLVDLFEQEEIYRELRMRGYEYNGEFQPILRADMEGTCGELLWTGKWIPFLDALFQLNTLSQKRVVGGGLVFPTRIRMIKIDPFAHFQVQKLVTKMVKSMSVPTSFRSIVGGVERPYVLPVVFDPITSRIVCGGVEILGVHMTPTGIQSWLPTTPVVSPVTMTTPVMTTPYTVGTTGLVNNFVPYVEKHFGEEYVMVDKCGGVEEPIVGGYKQNREFLEFYLNECKRYVSHIMRRVEQPTVVLGSIVPTVIPKTLEQQLECLKIVPTGVTGVYPTGVYGGEFVGTPYGKLLECGKLLQLLAQVANIESFDGQYLYKIQKIFNEKFAYLRALEEDWILNLVNNRSYYLKSILDTVLENTHHIFNGSVVVPRPIGVTGETFVPRLKVLEISPSMGHFFGAKMSNLMRLYPNRVGQIDYHYVPSMVGVHPTTVVPEEYICELNKQLPYEIKKVEWNFGLKNGQLITEVPSHLREYDLVILNGGLSSMLPYVESEYELKKWLQTVVMEKVLKPQGFLFVHEYTNSFDFLSTLNKLEQTLWTMPMTGMTTMPYKYTTGRFPYQKYQSEMQWRQLVEECGFYPVCMKSDVELSSMFLYRRPISTWYPTTTGVCGGAGIVEEKIFIDECPSVEQWIKKVRMILGEKAIERLWLLSEREPTVEIVSWINTLRREFGGEKIRCLFVGDRTPVSIYGQRYVVPSIGELVQMPFGVGVERVSSPWCELFNVVRKADLIMNVFRYGQWGSFRPVVTVRPQTYGGVYPVSPVYGNTTSTTGTYGYPFVTGSTCPFPVPTWSTLNGLRCPLPWVMSHLPVGYPFEWNTTTGVTGVVPTVVEPVCYETEYPITTGVRGGVAYRRPFTTGVMGTMPRQVVFNPLQTYIITSGLGSFGLELVEWCIEHGARRIIVTSKYGVRSGYQARKLRILRDEFNATIQVVPVDVREEVECLGLIKEALAMSVENKIGGIFHLGSYVEDMLFEQQYPVTQVPEVLRKICEYRCQGAFNLDKLTRGEGIMDEAGYFVVFAPVLSREQLTTPTVLEKICESRRRFGRHGFALQWGCNVETGLPVEQMFGYDNIVEMPTTSYVVPSRVFNCLRIFESLLCKSFEPTMWSHYVPVEKYWIPETVCPMTTYNTPYPYGGVTGVCPSTYWTGVPTYKSLVELLFTVLGVKDINRIVGCESLVTLGELGLDSVLALELKQLFETIYMTPLSLRDIQMLTIEKLRMIESRYPQGIFELYQPRPLTWYPRLRSVIVPRKTIF